MDLKICTIFALNFAFNLSSPKVIFFLFMTPSAENEISNPYLINSMHFTGKFVVSSTYFSHLFSFLFLERKIKLDLVI